MLMLRTWLPCAWDTCCFARLNYATFYNIFAMLCCLGGGIAVVWRICYGVGMVLLLARYNLLLI